MSYEYAKLGNTCRSSMRVLLSNTKFIDMNDPIYRESVKLSIPLKMDKNNSSKETSKEISKETLKGDTKETSKENMKEESRDDSKYRDDNKGKLLLNTNPILNQMP
jgi:hypothetical protein